MVTGENGTVREKRATAPAEKCRPCLTYHEPFCQFHRVSSDTIGYREKNNTKERNEIYFSCSNVAGYPVYTSVIPEWSVPWFFNDPIPALGSKDTTDWARYPSDAIYPR